MLLFIGFLMVAFLFLCAIAVILIGIHLIIETKEKIKDQERYIKMKEEK